MQTYYRTSLEAKARPDSELHETPLVDTYVDYFDTLESAAALAGEIEAIEAGN